MSVRICYLFNVKLQHFTSFEEACQMILQSYSPHACRSTCEDYVASLQRKEPADVAYQVVDPENHVSRVSALYLLAVDVKLEMQVLYFR